MANRRNRPYLVFGGYVVSINDEQTHYVSPIRVMELYGLTRAECILLQDEEDTKLRMCRREEHIEFHPDPTGRYQTGACVHDGRLRVYPIL